MTTDKGPIFLLTGPPGAGKSSVAVALLRRFPFGFHIPVDDLREWVVSGIAHPVPHWTDETTRQFQLARHAALQLAQQYASSGFAVVIDDIILAQEVEQLFTNALGDYHFYKVLLLPLLDVALQRNRERTHKAFDTSILADPISHLHQMFCVQARASEDWILIDNSHMTIEETVDKIMPMHL